MCRLLQEPVFLILFDEDDISPFFRRFVNSEVCTQRWSIVRSAKRCRHCILGLPYSAYFRLDSQNLTRHPPPQMWTVQYSVHCTRNTASNSGALASNWQKTSSPKYNDDISLLILQYLISVCTNQIAHEKIRQCIGWERGGWEWTLGSQDREWSVIVVCDFPWCGRGSQCSQYQ
jgi:hypothetical protein